ncbi:MAG: hypothetical protein VW079_01135 [Candidatus Woesearchaeota archaeon]|jgi:hypothetical protein
MSQSRKEYMKEYNQRPYVKRKKADYMRKLRSKLDQKNSEKLVELLLNYGFEDWAESIAEARAPHMLIKNTSRRRK